jgi:hypothetical protein
MLKAKSLLYALSVIATVCSIFAAASSAQTTFDKKTFLKKYLDASAKLPVKHRKLLSSGYQNLLQVAAAVNAGHIKAGIGDDGGTFSNGFSVRAAQAVRPQLLSAGPGGTTRVSNPALDFINSEMAGFTQSESSSAWCGKIVVAGYNDSGAYLRTAGVNFNAAWSFNGVSVSLNGGKSFTDLGLLNPGTDPANFLSGDPVVTCNSSSQFYYSSILATATPPDPQGNRNPLSAISVSSSSTGGVSWGNPAVAIAKDGFSHILDKPWMTLDPINPLRLFVTYTDFDFSFPTTGTCANDSRIAIELVSSADGGHTWSAPVVIDEECGASFNGVQGSNVIVSPGGKVHVAYEFYPSLIPNNEIHIVTSSNHGQSFGKIVVVNSEVVPNGSGGLLQGGFRNNEFPQLAVDRSNGSSRGIIYVVWSDGRNNQVVDIISPTGIYAYPDVLVSKSTNHGESFSQPIPVSPTPGDFSGNGRDQFFPGVAVDKNGHVGVCYYDRREDPNNTVIDRYCSVSTNLGATWTEQQVSSSSWLPLHFSDQVINPTYIGDYDALTSDFLLESGGFFGTFEIQTNGNPDIFAKKF